MIHQNLLSSAPFQAGQHYAEIPPFSRNSSNLNASFPPLARSGRSSPPGMSLHQTGNATNGFAQNGASAAHRKPEFKKEMAMHVSEEEKFSICYPNWWIRTEP